MDKFIRFDTPTHRKRLHIQSICTTEPTFPASFTVEIKKYMYAVCVYFCVFLLLNPGRQLSAAISMKQKLNGFDIGLLKSSR